MQHDVEQRIRERAHQIWEEEGRPHGRDREHWEQASREILGNQPADTARDEAEHKNKGAALAH